MLFSCAVSYADASDIASLYSDCIVMVEAVSEGGESIGSGLFVTSDGYIITNAHVVEGENLRVTLKDKTSCPAALVGYDVEKDIALIKTDINNSPCVTFGSSSELKAGEDIVVIGAPKGLDQTVTKGIISNLSREHMGNTYIQVDAAINQGNSGGPVFNMNGAVVGMVTLKDRSSDGIAFAIPSDVIMNFLENSKVPYSTKLGSLKPEPQKEETAKEDSKASEKPKKSPDKKKNISKVYIYAAGAAALVLLGGITALIIFMVKRKRINALASSGMPADMPISGNISGEDLSDINIVLGNRQQAGTQPVRQDAEEDLTDIDIELK